MSNDQWIALALIICIILGAYAISVPTGFNLDLSALR